MATHPLSICGHEPHELHRESFALGDDRGRRVRAGGAARGVPPGVEGLAPPEALLDSPRVLRPARPVSAGELQQSPCHRPDRLRSQQPAGAKNVALQAIAADGMCRWEVFVIARSRAGVLPEGLQIRAETRLNPLREKWWSR